MIARQAGGIRGRLLRGERRTFARSAETQRSRTLPRQNVAIHVGDGHDRVVEGRLHVAQSMGNVLALLLLERLLLAFFLRCGRAARCCWLCHESVLGFLSSQFSETPVLTENRELSTESWFLGFRRRLLLGRHSPFARAFTSARVGMSALPADRQVPAVTKAAIGADFDEPFDVHRNFLA